MYTTLIVLVLLMGVINIPFFPNTGNVIAATACVLSAGWIFFLKIITKSED